MHLTTRAESTTLPHAAPTPTPTPTVAPLLFEANDAMGVLPPHPELAAAPKPKKAPGASRPSQADSAGEVTQRSLQVPRWVAGSMMVAAFGVLALGGVLVHQGLITFKSSTANAHQATDAAPATQNAVRPVGEQASPGRVVAAAFSDAAPNAAQPAPAPASPAPATPRAAAMPLPLLLAPRNDETKKESPSSSEPTQAHDEAAKDKAASAESASSSDAGTAHSASFPEEKPAGDGDRAEEAKTSEADQSAEAGPPGPPPPPFDKAAASVALGAAQARAQTCRKSTDQSGIVKVVVTFAPSGRATNASLSGAFAGTETGSCIASSFRGATVPAFTGSMVTVSKTVMID